MQQYLGLLFRKSCRLLESLQLQLLLADRVHQLLLALLGIHLDAQLFRFQFTGRFGCCLGGGQSGCAGRIFAGTATWRPLRRTVSERPVGRIRSRHFAECLLVDVVAATGPVPIRYVAVLPVRRRK